MKPRKNWLSLKPHIPKNQSRSLVFVACSALCLAFACGIVRAKPNEKEKSEKEQIGISLQVSVVLNKPGPMLAFIATNNSKKDVGVAEPGFWPTPLVFVKPDGKEVELQGFADSIAGPPVLKAGETKTWQLDAFQPHQLQSVECPRNLSNLLETRLFSHGWRQA